tara:strand:- start:86 stop:250 length:165 start_codon:yes stop_codon:yes gene_type:complete
MSFKVHFWGIKTLATALILIKTVVLLERELSKWLINYRDVQHRYALKHALKHAR